MSCRKTWDPIFLRRFMTRSFMENAYKTHRETVLLERHRALLPSTMPLVALDKTKLTLTSFFSVEV
jgi:hypothetical protein